MKHDLADKDLSGAAEAFRRLCASDRKVNDQPGSILTLAVWRAGQVLSGVPGVRAFVLCGRDDPQAAMLPTSTVTPGPMEELTDTRFT